MARESWAGSGEKATAAVWLALRDRLGPTAFAGYDDVERRRRDPGPGQGDGARGRPRRAAARRSRRCSTRTPFYAESGGQAGDRGEVEWSGGARARCSTPARQAGDLHVHTLEITAGALELGRRASRLAVDAERRARTRLNHSAAHLVHAALRHVLGPHVAQKGQMVDGERMRFDFSHGAPLTPAELDAIEAEVNAVIRQNLPPTTREMAPEAAIERRRHRPVRREVRRHASAC